MRVLHLLNDIQQSGNGIINLAIDIICLQAQSNLTVAVASAGGDYETLIANHGVRHFKLEQDRRSVLTLKAAQQYTHIIDTFKPDVVHVHMVTGLLLAWSLRGFNRYRIVSHLHNVHQSSSVLMGLADQVICVSDAVASYMNKKGISKRKILVVKNLNLGSPRIRPIEAWTPAVLEQPAIVSVAGLYYRKGIAELIAAFSLIAPKQTQAHLYLVGAGPEDQVFMAQAAASPVAERIHFLGFQKDPQAYMLAAHLFVLASHRDSFPLVLLEARQARCAIIASDVDGIPEALDYGAAGMLVPPKDVLALAQALEQLLSDPVAHAHWKQASQQNLEHYQAIHMAEAVTAAYAPPAHT